MKNLPYEITTQLIQCFGKCFHYKDAMEAFLISTGVKRETATKHRDEYKFVLARRLLAELSESDDGIILQHKILTDLCKLRDLPDNLHYSQTKQPVRKRLNFYSISGNCYQ